MVTVSRHGIDRDSYSAVFPSTSWTHRATGSMAHRQVILRPECRCVGPVRGRCNSVRDRAVVAPPGPGVLNACATALRGRCGDSVTRTGSPGKRLCRTVGSAINAEAETCRIRLDSHLDGRGRSRCWGRRRIWTRTRGRERQALQMDWHRVKIGVTGFCRRITIIKNDLAGCVQAYYLVNALLKTR